ncbi:MAG: dephospho-CoA kinase [Acidiphilium sp. 37-64-53]|uniref:dephospho-CoA kinase n=1 Tax=Acidiphilium TaxID=522 RepID=UPI000BC8752B|nr:MULTISPECIES: dephospho-CoA kinase [Acidiphilium]MBW4037067.1 dephospho-CoA kinase [Pseudomonadota bacterium]OYW00424.1 MAG: dephospho-CoA kinase [Acidiphilium sp. 37-64-53]OZB25642.1 MAG: dephospho-CoA kinase [Acidiphilium sp. 34-64-41]HQT86504.1 dephospho-CoA kinase [Acidiphilium rubrum]
MRIIGLTGGIGMGKSTVASMFRRRGVPVFDADAVVRRLQAPGGAALPAIAAAFPGVVRGDVLDRAALRAVVLADGAARRRLEAIMHRMVRRAEGRFLAQARRRRVRAVVLDIPLLFETGGERRVDVAVTVSAPRSVQVARVRRRGLAEAEIARIIGLQMPDAEKRRRAEVVIFTGLSRGATVRAVQRFIARQFIA